MENKNVIGLVGGVGPYAGLDLVTNVFDETIAATDQEHLPVILISLPEEIEDRTKFLRGDTKVNPAKAIVEILRKLEAAGATVAGIPCNTAHAPLIFDAVREGLKRHGLSVNLLHMIDETASFVKKQFPDITNFGLLSTSGTAKSEVYQHAFKKHGLSIQLPPDDIHATKVHASIYDPKYGIKAFSNPVTSRAREQLLEAITWFAGNGVNTVLLGCTEIPLAIPEKDFKSTRLINPTRILARALISHSYPAKLKKL